MKSLVSFAAFRNSFKQIEFVAVVSWSHFSTTSQEANENETVAVKLWGIIEMQNNRERVLPLLNKGMILLAPPQSAVSNYK
ncbi:hypothetical protein TNCT_617671 [Trichonephila clavata]|uniref:Uncharacterized protein n=1 Tax=Trichonephila clavata TaxID=2740835 RepID=A0A8X6HXH5_TRICU|nr:hypothetical protein TNCT_617671 [Trichonephila clavata]